MESSTFRLSKLTSPVPRSITASMLRVGSIGPSSVFLFGSLCALLFDAFPGSPLPVSFPSVRRAAPFFPPVSELTVMAYPPFDRSL